MRNAQVNTHVHAYNSYIISIYCTCLCENLCTNFNGSVKRKFYKLCKLNYYLLMLQAFIFNRLVAKRNFRKMYLSNNGPLKILQIPGNRQTAGQNCEVHFEKGAFCAR